MLGLLLIIPLLPMLAAIKVHSLITHRPLAEYDGPKYLVAYLAAVAVLVMAYRALR